MTDPTSTGPTIPSLPNTEDWRQRWQHQDAWTVREFAQLCCGWNPTIHEFPNREDYNEAVESINRAVRVKVLRTIELLWPPSRAERLYDDVPMFRPCDVAAWAAKRYPDTFPYSGDAWERDKLENLNVVGGLAGGGRCSAVWEDITIEFISDHRVQITAKDRTYSRNYAEMGCEDARNQAPNKAWEALRALAESGGVLAAAADGDWARTEKRMQEIRRVLREHFESEQFDISSETDPLPYIRTVGYRAVFALGRRSSFDT